MIKSNCNTEDENDFSNLNNTITPTFIPVPPQSAIIIPPPTSHHHHVNSSSKNRIPPPPQSGVIIPPPPPPITTTTTSSGSNNTVNNVNNNNTQCIVQHQPSIIELNNAMSRLKKPTQQHIVGFKERYEQALRMEQDDFSKYNNRKYLFCKKRQEWIRYNPIMEELLVKEVMNEVIEFPSELKIITLNVWFANILQSQRYEEQLRVFKSLNADIICLQEVIPSNVQDHIMMNEFIREHYMISDIDGTSVSPYGVMILVKKILPILDIRISKLTSRMGRCLITCSFSKQPMKDYSQVIQYFNAASTGKPIKELESIYSSYAVIGTVHLESMGTSERRKIQLGEIYPILQSFQGACELTMLMGDFNFDSSSNENLEIQNGLFKHFKDIWYHLYPNQVKEGKTYLFYSGGGHRLDRMLIQSNNQNNQKNIFEPHLMKIIGNQKLDLSESDQQKLRESFNMEHTCMSDHFGLYCEIKKSE